MHHKRKRRKNARAGCLLCEAHKANGMKGTLGGQTFQEQRARLSEQEERRNALGHVQS